MNPTTNDFDALLARARQGDRAAQGKLVDIFRGYLRVLARRQMDSRLDSRVDASDVIQETCLTALASFEQFRGTHQGEFVAWLKVLHEHVIQNLVRNHVHTQKRSVTRENRVTGSQLAQLGNAMQCSTPSQKLMQGELAVRLALSLEALAEDQREAVRLRYCEAWPLERIATHMGRSKPSVAGLLKRGLAALRAELRPAGRTAESSTYVVGRVSD
jgi:RNA polymerase sigma-70 factor, ECF subfamily